MCSSGFTDFRAWTFDLWKCTLIHVGEKIFQKTEKTLCANFKKKMLSALLQQEM